MSRTKNIFLIIVLLVIVGFVGYMLMRPHHSINSTNNAAIKYHCPMHPNFISDKPGECSICGMDLVPIQEEAVSMGQGEKPNTKIMYKSTMNPDEISEEPGKDSMGMEMVPFEVEENNNTSGGDAAVEGLAAVTVSPEKQQLIGVQTGFAQYRELNKIIRATGKIAYDPDLFTAQTEYMEAIKARKKIKDSPMPDVKERSDSMVNSAKSKLALMGLSENQIRELEKNDEGSNYLLIAKKGGKVWVYAQIYEYESSQVKIGQTIKVTSKAFPDKIFNGTIRSIDAILDPGTRSLRVRAELENPDSLLRPESFVNAEININLGNLLSVPKEAILDTGIRQIAFIDSGSGRFEPREVKLGEETDDFYQVISGLSAGDKVVTSANFLIDSESRLKSALSDMSK